MVVIPSEARDLVPLIEATLALIFNQALRLLEHTFDNDARIRRAERRRVGMGLRPHSF